MQNINIISNLKDKLKNYSQNYYHNLKTKNNFYYDKYVISAKNISYNDASVQKDLEAYHKNPLEICYKVEK